MTSERRGIKEPFSGISHAVGAILSLIGMIALLILAWGRPRYMIGFTIYGVSMILLYTASALFHSLHVSPQRTLLLQRLDHTAIFLLIAGTYTPVCLVALHGSFGWQLLAAVYTIAVLGIISEFAWTKQPPLIRVALYIMMGWLCLIALPRLGMVLPGAAIQWLVAGGIIYTIGTIFYASRRPNLWPGKFEAHDLWHVFVLGGSACHFMLMLNTLAIH